MHPNLLPAGPLSQVIFIHDYMQLAFQDSGFSIYNIAVLRSKGISIQQSQRGFCDSLVGLIGQPLLSVMTNDDSSLILTFQDGSVLSVASTGTNPEAWQFKCLGKAIVVAQNA